ncbi:MAG: hypothetical protein ACFFD7_12315 [Candidatus Thorarchaeota archaeon]
MISKLKNKRKKGFRNWFQDYSLNAPPYDNYSAFQPGSFFRMYHRVEAEKMRRSYDWIGLMYEAKKMYEKTINDMIEVYTNPVMTSKREKIWNIEIEEWVDEFIDESKIVTPLIDKGTLTIELGDDDNKKVIKIDLKDIEV